jgi:translation initiation factor eIF-2B subunit epsilon
MIKNYIKTSKWANKVEVVSAVHHRSVGDILRDLDEKQLIVGDFILVQGCTVSNADLTDAIETHRKRREKDKNAIMTMVLKESSKKCKTR